MGKPSNFSQEYFRIRLDDSVGLNVNSGWAADENVNWGSYANGDLLRIRFKVREFNNAANNTQFKLKVSLNGGAYVDIGVIGLGAAPATIAQLSSQFTDGALTTELLTNVGETFVSGEGVTDNLTGVYALQNESTEFEWCLKSTGFHDGPANVTTGDTLSFRVYESDDTAFSAYTFTPTVTVGLGNNFIGGRLPQHPAHIEILGAGAGGVELVTFIQASNSSPSLIAIRTADDGLNWSEVDGANRPTQTPVSGFSNTENWLSDTHLVHYNANGVFRHRFLVSPSLIWDTVDESIDLTVTPPTTEVADIFIRLDNLNNEQYVVCYGSAESPNSRVYYNIKTFGGSWGGRQEIDTTSGVNFISPVAVLSSTPTGEVMYFLYKDDSNGIIYLRSLSNTNVLGPRHTISTGIDSGTNSDNIPYLVPIATHFGGNDYVLVLYQKTAGGPLFSRVVFDDTTVRPELQVTTSGVRRDQGDNNAVIALARQKGTYGLGVGVVFSADGTGDLFRVNIEAFVNPNLNWSSESSAGITVRNGVDWIKGTAGSINPEDWILRIIYDDGGQGGTGYLWYAEVPLLRIQNFYHSDPVSVTESVTVSIVAPILDVSRSESISVTEEVDVEIPLDLGLQLPVTFDTFKVWRRGVKVHGAVHYIDLVKGTAPDNLMGFWSATELQGSVIVNHQGDVNRNGTYSNVSLNDINGPFGLARAGLWDGATSYGDIYSPELNSALNFQEVSIGAWVRVSDGSVWTDGLTGWVLQFRANINNRIFLTKNGASNQVGGRYTAGGTVNDFTKSSFSSTDWFFMVLTASLSNDRARFYVEGVQEGADQTGLGTWTGSLSSTECVLGASITTPSNVLDGYTSYAFIYNKELTAVEITNLYNGGSV